MSARFSWNLRNTRGHRPRLQKCSSLSFRQLPEQLREPLRQLPARAASNGPAVYFDDRRKLAKRSGTEHLVGTIDLRQRQIPFLMRYTVGTANVQDCRARDP